MVKGRFSLKNRDRFWTNTNAVGQSKSDASAPHGESGATHSKRPLGDSINAKISATKQAISSRFSTLKKDPHQKFPANGPNSNGAMGHNEIRHNESGVNPSPPTPVSPFSNHGPDGFRPPPDETQKFSKSNNDGSIKRLIKRLVKPILLTSATLALTAAIPILFFIFVVMAPRVPASTDLWNINRQSSIVMLDKAGEEMMSRGARYGEAIAIDELPDFLVMAFLATEDRRFYEHFGVDIRGTLRAAVTNFRSGRVVQGGSTITQQLAKNLFLKPDRTYKRKIREALLALWLEGRYSKEELLSLYINRIYLGAGAYGVEQASQTYFNKSARDVTLAEAAMLAGLPKAPSSLAPTNNLEAAKKRSAEVLKNLTEIDAISPFDAHVASLRTPALANDISSELGYVFDYISAKARGLIESYDGDLIISTTLDPAMQAGAENALRARLTEEIKEAGASQAALISYSIDGATLALVGGLNYRESQFNRASQARRQPGSAFKPFVYLAALEAGIKPEAKYVDQPINIDGWEPKNYSSTYSGSIRLTEAMARSINTVSVQLSEQVGREKVMEIAKRLGIKSPLNPHPSLALGATDLTLEELTTAYLPMARAGTKIDPYIITQIKDQEGNILYERSPQNSQRVFTPEIGESLNHLLYQVMLTGTGRGANLDGHQTMGKTGTTNDWRDAWFVGYSGQIVTGVWVGNDNSKGMEKITGGSVPASIWKDYMQIAHKDLPSIQLAGAYPAITITNEPVLLDFYADVSTGFSRIVRERRKSDRQLSREARQQQARENNQRRQSRKKKRRRGFFGLGRRKRDN